MLLRRFVPSCSFFRCGPTLKRKNVLVSGFSRTNTSSSQCFKTCQIVDNASISCNYGKDRFACWSCMSTNRILCLNPFTMSGIPCPFCSEKLFLYWLEWSCKFQMKNNLKDLGKIRKCIKIWEDTQILQEMGHICLLPLGVWFLLPGTLKIRHHVTEL